MISPSFPSSEALSQTVQGLLFGPGTFLETQKLEPSTQGFVWPWPEKVFYFFSINGARLQKDHVWRCSLLQDDFISSEGGLLAHSTNFLGVNLFLPNWLGHTGFVNFSLMSFCHEQKCWSGQSSCLGSHTLSRPLHPCCLAAIWIWISLLAPWMRNQMHTAYVYQLHIFPLKLLFFLSIEGMICVS